MRLSVVKPLHASWLVKKTDLIKSAFVAAGITCNRWLTVLWLTGVIDWMFV